MKKKFIIIILLILLLLSAVAAGLFWYIFMQPNGKSTFHQITVYEDTPYENILNEVKANNMVQNSWTFEVVAKVLKYNLYPKKGKYKIEEGENNLTIIRRWRQGQHYTLNFTFNNVRTKEQLLEKVGDRFLFPNDSLKSLLNNVNFLSAYQLTPETVLSVFLPNTYQFYYDISAEDFFEKMLQIYNQFWNEKRLAQAKILCFTPLEISVIASIVEEENHKAFEKPIIAGVYINRLKCGMKLQADPTVKYAVGDFTLKRVLDKHLSYDSPYNTYIPEASTLDSVLNYTRHNYLYMCAKEDFSQEHYFTHSYQQHLRYARRYHQALNRNKIK